MESHEKPDDWQTQRRSHSQRRTYRTCGQKFLFQYQAGWKRTTSRGTYAFGHAIQQVADLIVLRLAREPLTAEMLFRAKWDGVKDDPLLTWTDRMPWATLRDRGVSLVRHMVTELPKVLGRPDPTQLDEQWTYELAPGVKEIVRPDFYGPVYPLPTYNGLLPPGIPHGVIDFKTGDRKYEATAAELDEQLSNYQHAEQTRGRPVDVVGLCVLVYTKEPQVQWLLHPARDAEEIGRFVAGAVQDDADIRVGNFRRNTAMCSYYGECEFKPLCYPSQAHRIETELTRTKPDVETLLDLDME